MPSRMRTPPPQKHIEKIQRANASLPVPLCSPCVFLFLRSFHLRKSPPCLVWRHATPQAARVLRPSALRSHPTQLTPTHRLAVHPGTHTIHHTQAQARAPASNSGLSYFESVPISPPPPPPLDHCPLPLVFVSLGTPPSLPFNGEPHVGAADRERKREKEGTGSPSSSLPVSEKLTHTPP